MTIFALESQWNTNLALDTARLITASHLFTGVLEGQTVKNDERLQFRTKDVIIGVLGVTLGIWSDWQDFDALQVIDIVG